MALAKFSKVVTSLPETLEKSTLYCVRNGQGFDLYVTNELGLVISYSLNMNSATKDYVDEQVAKPVWTDYVTRGLYVDSTAVAGGQRLAYTFEGQTIYRFVPSPYVNGNDVFYSDIDMTIEIGRRE